MGTVPAIQMLALQSQNQMPRPTSGLGRRIAELEEVEQRDIYSAVFGVLLQL
ncbi:hypothetical protein D3C81_2074300 [compost metagenome]